MKLSDKTINHITALFGIITVFLFILIGPFGGYYRSLSHFLFQEVSYSISPYTPYNEVSVPLYKQYNLYLVLFSTILGIKLKNPYAKLGALYLSFAGVVGFLLLHFPMDADGSGQTIVGMSHNMFAMILSIYISVALLLFVYAFKRVKKLQRLSVFTHYISIFFLTTSFLTGIFAFMSKPLFVGLIERFAVGAYLLWIIVVALSIA